MKMNQNDITLIKAMGSLVYEKAQVFSMWWGTEGSCVSQWCVSQNFMPVQAFCQRPTHYYYKYIVDL